MKALCSSTGKKLPVKSDNKGIAMNYEHNEYPLEHLGRGWSFPAHFHCSGSSVSMQTDIDNVEKCIQLLCLTRPGERHFWPDYGLDLEQYAFDELSYELLQLIEDTVAQAIKTYEPRVILESVYALPNEDNMSEIQVDIQYSIRSTSSTNNLVLLYSLEQARFI